jgi:hypothetical protein
MLDLETKEIVKTYTEPINDITVPGRLILIVQFFILLKMWN